MLVDKRVITPAQAESARIQSATLGVSTSEFLVKNGLVTERQLKELAPWFFNQTSAETQRRNTVETNESLMANTSGSCDDYDVNLARYRAILKDILGPES
ncbi:MAG: hypothetical protein KGS72_02170 [Cyanobacteria bacterium REEB67]|nr:hypothetical protein [Cyanobacteria bacterium REEB67]